MLYTPWKEKFSAWLFSRRSSLSCFQLNQKVPQGLSIGELFSKFNECALGKSAMEEKEREFLRIGVYFLFTVAFSLEDRRKLLPELTWEYFAHGPKVEIKDENSSYAFFSSSVEQMCKSFIVTAGCYGRILKRNAVCLYIIESCIWWRMKRLGHKNHHFYAFWEMLPACSLFTV